MLRSNTITLISILFLALVSLWVVWPQKPSNYLPAAIPWPERGWVGPIDIGDYTFVRKGMTLGLDLKGGINLILEADLSQRPPGEREQAMKGVITIIERRINAFGVSEPVIQAVGSNRLSIQLPGVGNVEEAKALVGKTANMDFREQKVVYKKGETVLDQAGQPVIGPDGKPLVPDNDVVGWVRAKADLNGEQRELTGAYFRPTAQVVFDPQTNQPQVSFEFNAEGARLFEQITTRLAPPTSGGPGGKPLGIFLDNQLISSPTVQAVISNRGVITGVPLDEARTLAIQLNAGALPVPVSIIKEQNVDATLGADSIKKSIVAGEIGMAMVFLFMALQYRLPGVLAGGALIVYALLVLAIFKLVPVTLTLAGIAAFILSVGMAVDANILIFERMKEELRSGRGFASALEAGFDRAWPSIRDSNVSTFITCAILFWFGRQFGASMVQGFALTLALGVAVSMFSAITITRTFLRALIGRVQPRSRWFLGAD